MGVEKKMRMSDVVKKTKQEFPLKALFPSRKPDGNKISDRKNEFLNHNLKAEKKRSYFPPRWNMKSRIRF